MKVVMLSVIDYAGSAYKMYEAISRYTDINIQLFSGMPENRLNHPVNVLVTDKNRAMVQAEVNSADILHFKGDWPPIDGYLGLRIPDKPIVLTTSGSFFRKRSQGGFEKYTARDYYRATLKTSFETDLLYPEYSDVWTPHPIDCDDKPILVRQTACPIFQHIPSSPERKGTKFVSRLFIEIKLRLSCRTEIITGVNFQQATEMKKISTVYFDQFFVGFFGNSALEAMQYGIPTCAWISPQAISQAKGKLADCPVINLNPADITGSVEKILSVYNDDSLSLKTKKWCDDVHGYRATAERWEKLYKSL